MWFAYVLLSMLCSGCVVIFLKYALKRTDSTLAAEIWVFVLLCIVLFTDVKNQFLVEYNTFLAQMQMKTFLLLLLSGICVTGFLWFEFYALYLGEIHLVLPVNGSYIIVMLLIRKFWYKESISIQTWILAAVFFLGIILLLLSRTDKFIKNQSKPILFAGVATLLFVIWKLLPSYGLLALPSNGRFALDFILAFLFLLLLLLFTKKQNKIYSLSFLHGSALCLSALFVWGSLIFYQKASGLSGWMDLETVMKYRFVAILIFAVFVLKEKWNLKSVIGTLCMMGAYLYLT